MIVRRSIVNGLSNFESFWGCKLLSSDYGIEDALGLTGE